MADRESLALPAAIICIINAFRAYLALHSTVCSTRIAAVWGHEGKPESSCRIGSYIRRSLRKYESRSVLPFNSTEAAEEGQYHYQTGTKETSCTEIHAIEKPPFAFLHFKTLPLIPESVPNVMYILQPGLTFLVAPTARSIWNNIGLDLNKGVEMGPQTLIYNRH